ncbi:MAG: 4Fe-4S dicluster domain-containing protein [Fidelibacterota bacterium]|nr:MAG: 4Fe-4S dicluster domain-containing protein [Candidatus Neomarinimicrobiota bacterium]
MDRKKFFKTVGIAGTSLVAMSSTADARTRIVSPDWMGMLTDLSLCIGCRKCEWACNEANKLPNKPIQSFDDPSVFQEERRTHAEQFTVVNRFEVDDRPEPVFVKKQCMHCAEPACASACLVRAFSKTAEGPVLYNKDVCIGCRYCMIACPFLVPTYEYADAFSPEVKKCTMCFERFTQQGEVPACAGICPREAITFGKRSDLLKLAREKIRSHPDRYVDHIYGEHEVGGTNWLYISPVPFEELGFRTDLGETPYPEMTRPFLSAVPLVLSIWPMLLMGSYMFSKKREGEAPSTDLHERVDS